MTMTPPNQPPYQGPQQPTSQFPQQGPAQGPRLGPQQGPPQGQHGSQEHHVPPAGYAGQPPAAASPKANKATQTVWTLGLISLLGVILGLSLSEDGSNDWGNVKAWGGLAIAGAALTLAPAVRSSMNLTVQRAWQVAVCGAGALVLFWVLFTLPSVGTNTSLLTTIGVAAGVISAWIAPGRETGAGAPQRPTW